MTGNETTNNLWVRTMSILKLRSNLVEKIKDFGSSFHPKLKKPLERSFLIKNINQSLTRILSIDDNKICQKITLNHLQKFDCYVDCVSSARAALEKLVVSYRIIFLDVNLPDCSTDVLINLIRSDEGNINQTVPIILTSSWLTDASKRNYLALGVNEVYIKPIKEKDFKKILIDYSVIS